MTARASKEQMEKMHKMLCEVLTDFLDKKGWNDANGNWVPLPAAYLTAAIAFLSHNDIKGIPLDTTKSLGKLANMPNVRSILDELRADGHNLQ